MTVIAQLNTSLSDRYAVEREIGRGGMAVNARGFTFNNIHADYDLMKDSRTLIGFRTRDDEAQIVAVYNWRSEILARMRAPRVNAGGLA
jgi:hypothetical protein